MNTATAAAVPVTGDPYPLEVREAIHSLCRRFPNGRINVIEPVFGVRFWTVQIYVCGVIVGQERAYPGFARQLALDVGGPRIDSQWDEREAI